MLCARKVVFINPIVHKRVVLHYLSMFYVGFHSRILCVNYYIYFSFFMVGNGMDIYDELHGRGKTSF